MSDYIKREDAIDYLVTNMNWFDADGIETSEEEKRADITELVNGVSSADVAPVRHGRWIETCYDEYKCSYCEKVVREEILYAIKPSDREYASLHIANYCPNCGAKMDGDADD